MNHIVMVTGKGGVGKSFVAALLARKASLEGKKVLLVDMVPESYLSHALQVSVSVPSKIQTQKTRFGFDYALWTGEACLAEYIQYWIKIPFVSSTFLANKWLQSLIALAPGLREISFLGKLTSHVRRHGPPLDYDHIIVDAVSTGHFLALIKTPSAFAKVVQTGPMYEQSSAIEKVLNNSQTTSFCVVHNFEKFAVNEMGELLQQLKLETKGQLVVVGNKEQTFPESLRNVSLSGENEQEFFLKTQREIADEQQKLIEEFRKQQETFVTVPFYFSPMANILEDKDEVRRLFKEL